MDKKKLRIASVVIVLLCLFLYGNSRSNRYALDDDYVILNNRHVKKGLKGIPKIFTSHYVNADNESHSYRPVTLTSFAIEYHFFRAKPAVSHTINILLYAITCLVLFRLLLRLFRDYHWILAAVATFIFIIHPIHTEVVNNVKSRDELLCFLFAISSLFQFIKYIDRKKLIYLLLGALFFGLSILSKLNSLTFIAIIPLTLWFFTDIKLKKLLLFGAGIILLLFTIRFGIMHTVDPSLDVNRNVYFYENPMFMGYDSIFERIPMTFYTIGYYLKLLIFPQPLICYYGFDHVEIAGWNNVFFWISLILILPVTIYALIKIKTRQIWIFGLLYFLITISMFSNVLRPAVGIIAERFAYLPSLGFCILLAFGAVKLFKIPLDKKELTITNKPVFYGVASVLLILCSSVIITRNKDWKDSLTLLRNDIKYAEKSVLMNELLANKLLVEITKEPSPNFRLKLAQESIRHYQKSVEIYPDHAIAWNNMGTVYFNHLADVKSAKSSFLRAVEIDPDYTVAWFSLGYCYESYKEFDEAKDCYTKVLELEPGHEGALTRLKLLETTAPIIE